MSKRRIKKTFLITIALFLVIVSSVPLGMGKETSSIYLAEKGTEFIGYDELAQELKTIKESSERVNLEVIDESIEGRSIYLTIIAEPVVSSIEDVGERCVTLLMARQHGNEPAVTDASLNIIRYLANGEDAAQLLENQVVLVIPMVNPDGSERNTRENGEGVDINRDHMALTTPEARAVQKVVLEWEPHVVIDHHEYLGIGIPFSPIRIYDWDLTTMYPNNENVEPTIRMASEDFMYNWIWPAVKEAGYTIGDYGIITLGGIPIKRIAGGPDPAKTRNQMGLHNCIAMLAESSMLRIGPTGKEIRIDSQEVVMLATLNYVHENSRLIKSGVEFAKENATKKGENKEGLIYLDDEVVAPPWGYLVHSSSEKVIENLKLHGIVMEKLEQNVEVEDKNYPFGSYLVKMAQPKRGLIPLLLEKGSYRNQLNGESVVRVEKPLEKKISNERGAEQKSFTLYLEIIVGLTIFLIIIFSILKFRKKVKK